MSLINFKDIDSNKSINKTNKTINFNGSEIQIINYLSANDKYDLIMITLQKALDRNIYNPFKIDLFFDLNVVYLYTNIIFDTDDREDEFALYDNLKQSGLIDAIKAEIPTEELDYLKSCIWQLTDIIIKYRNTFGSVFSNFIEQLPQNMEKAKDIVENIDPNKYQHFLSMASQLKANLPIE